MELFALSGLINALVAVSFGVLVFLKNWRERQNQIFFLMTAALAVWGFSYWRWLLATEHDAALLWVRLLAVGSVFIPAFFLDWISNLLQQKRKAKFFVSLAYIAAVAVAAFANTEYIITGLEQKLSFPFWPNPGLFYTVYIFFLYVGIVLYSFYMLYRQYVSEKQLQKRGQILYILWGSALGFGGGFTNFLLWYGIPIPPYGTFLVAAFPFLLGFSVVRYGLFNAKSIATEILVFFIGVILFIQFILSKSLTEYILRGAFLILVIAFGVLLIRSVYKEVSQREKIEKLSDDKSKFVSFASHEIRGPLTFIKGTTANILEGDFGNIREDLKDNLQKIFVRSNEILGLVEQYLDKSKLELGQLKYDMVDFDLGATVSQTIHNYQPSADQLGVSLEFNAEEGKDYTINGDQAKIKEVLNNLVDNAIKFSPKGKVEVALSRTDNAVLVKIADSGIGISKETMPILFQEFSRADNADKAKIAGTGLGLFLSKTFVEVHGGRIWAESEGTGKGATFFVELPLKM